VTVRIQKSPQAEACGLFCGLPSMAATPSGPSLHDVKNRFRRFFVAAIGGG
jgi:hypothetical protein